ncbi:unnamed protein product [Pleuronectes platessa]|uniref:Uncharacterized protein n=1 Tax=Pleuronectes platessa TaxID=8262 RepID=A0A9N7UAZ9_PLEPL|nr:unnamed protein product [Pleuronectes platessa]
MHKITHFLVLGAQLQRRSLLMSFQSSGRQTGGAGFAISRFQLAVRFTLCSGTVGSLRPPLALSVNPQAALGDSLPGSDSPLQSAAHSGQATRLIPSHSATSLLSPAFTTALIKCIHQGFCRTTGPLHLRDKTAARCLGMVNAVSEALIGHREKAAEAPHRRIIQHKHADANQASALHGEGKWRREEEEEEEEGSLRLCYHGDGMHPISLPLNPPPPTPTTPPPPPPPPPSPPPLSFPCLLYSLVSVLPWRHTSVWSLPATCFTPLLWVGLLLRVGPPPPEAHSASEDTQQPLEDSVYEGLASVGRGVRGVDAEMSQMVPPLASYVGSSAWSPAPSESWDRWRRIPPAGAFVAEE